MPARRLRVSAGDFRADSPIFWSFSTWLVNWISMLAIAVVPASITYTFGKKVGRPRAGWMLYMAMAVLFTVGLAICHFGESRGNPRLQPLGVAASNMEGKEVRFGIPQSVLAAATTSNGATGSTNAQPDSFTPIGLVVPLCNMLMGEIIFGGLGRP